MGSGTRFGLATIAVVALGISGSLTAVQPPPESDRAVPDFDIRAGRAPAAPSAAARAALQRARDGGERAARVNPHTGAIRVLDGPAGSLPPGASVAAAQSAVATLAGDLALDASDVADLRAVRDYVSDSTGLRHIVFAQVVDAIPVFEGVIAVHTRSDGSIVRMASSAARGAGRQRLAAVTQARAAAIAATDIARPFRQNTVQGQVWFPMDGELRLAWHLVIEPDAPGQLYDVLVDALNGQLLLRRNRVRYAEGTGRVVQSAATQLLDPRRPDQMPLGADGPGGCPPPVNNLVRTLNGPFRDPATVLFDTGRLSGNNTHVYRVSAPNDGAMGTSDGTAWSFDFPFNSAASAETALFFATNFLHDFFYDLGFTEAAGNFQLDNFGRGGVGGDPLNALARASGRNNAYYQHAPDGSSGTIAMFLWDGIGCWGQDVNGDGSIDIDGDYDTDIIFHEFHHGVSLRLNTAWTGDEAGAIGEGGSDFFAYSLNGDTTLAEYSRPGGIRRVNNKTYADWFCLFGFFCEPHANGEIFVNVLWDVRERFVTDLVRGSEAAAINESHQLYVDALKLSPPAPTMLDMRDAMLLADSLRNPLAPASENSCRIWESFAGRGMGVNATDTADNGFNQVGADFTVPSGCQPPPPPLTVTLAVTDATATEAGPTSGTFRISRNREQNVALTVGYSIAGSAVNGTDYATLSGSVAIPPGATSIDVDVIPVDDTVLESNETVTLTLRANAAYTVGTPSSGTVTITSDDVAPDLAVTTVTAPQYGGAGGSIVVTDSTKNQGTGASPVSSTSFYLSKNSGLDAGDALLGSREVPELVSGATHAGSVALSLPDPLDPGTYTLIAKADGPGSIVETNELNNTRNALVRIGPDLTITAMTAPSTAGAGAAIVVADTTTNSGGGESDAATTTRLFLSANATLDASDVQLGERGVAALDAGTSSPGSTTVTIPAQTTTGQYYVIAKADAANAVSEFSETNNTRYVLVRVGPDLTVPAVSAPQKGAAGGTIVVTDTTRNNGAGAAPASVTALYLSSNSVLDGSDVRLSSGRAVPALAAGASSVGSATVTLPDIAPGRWYILAQADDASAVSETLETNNVGFTTISIGPDLMFSSVSVPATGVPGGTIVVSHALQNAGAQNAGASAIKFYLSTNSIFDSGDTDFGTGTDVEPLAAGATSNGSTTLTLPSGLSGTYYVFVVADGTDLVVESNEGNNRTWRSIRIGS